MQTLPGVEVEVDMGIHKHICTGERNLNKPSVVAGKLQVTCC
jgi:hypothetical protein